MDALRLFGIGIAGLIISGCQTWQGQDVDSLPPTEAGANISQPGVVDIHYWNGLYGSGIENLTGNENFPDNPDFTAKLTELRGETNRGNRYGALVTGYIIPPEDGLYRFFLSADDQAQFLISDGENPDNKQIIATVPSWVPREDYSVFEEQVSEPVSLSAQSRYYFEIRHKEFSGGDHFSVAWEGPGIPRQVIGSAHIATLGQPPYPDSPEIREAYSLGYRVGYLDGSVDLSFDARYPPIDQDNDRLYDNWEIIHGLDPTDPDDALTDPDGDLLTATDEFTLGTAENLADTDGDAIPDGAEFAYGLAPTNPSDATMDLDGDGASNLIEYESGSAIDDASDTPSIAAPSVDDPQSPEPDGSVTISWVAPLTRQDGSSIALSEIESYEIRYGQSPSELDNSITVDGTETSASLTDLATGTWHFSVRVIDSANRASEFSDPISHEVE